MPARAGGYWSLARAPRYSVTFALPLLLLYEALAFLLSGDAIAGVRNGADVLLKSLFLALGGRYGLAAFTAMLLGWGGWLVWRDARAHRGGLRGGVFAGMLAESVAYAMVVGVVASQLTGLLLERLALAGPVAELGLGTQLMVSLGAGLYEELLFRVLLVGALAAAARRGLGWPAWAAGAAATLAGAVIFSAFHYIGPYGDAFEPGSFTFRAIAGVLFSALYLLRGFGIAAWTHALYDVFVTLG